MAAFTTGFLLAISLCLDLGVVNLAIIKTGLEHGRRAALLVGLGSTLGDFVYFGLAAFGAAAVVGWPPVRWTLWLAGTALLLYLAWRMIREAIRPHPIASGGGARQPAPPPFESFMFGIKVAIASPTAILWFAAVGGGVVASYGGNRAELLPFTAGFGAAGVVWALVLSHLAAGAGRLGGPRLVRGMSIVAAVLFLYFAVSIFVRGLRDLIGQGLVA